MKERATSQEQRAKSSSFLRHTLRVILPNNKWLRRIVLSLIALILISVGAMYGIAQWYINSQQDKPYTMGVSFIPDYANYLGIEPKETMGALLGIGVRHFRLVGYWSNIEREKGTYDFSQLDWQFKKAEQSGSTVSLALGLRQPRWPECHAPNWVDTSQPTNQWYPHLENFIKAVVNRYKNSPALISYQLENEYFLSAFGECENYDPERLNKELKLVQNLDPNHPVIISRSQNGVGIALRQPLPDKTAISIYRRVWDDKTNRYLQYPFPAWYYGFLAGWQKLATGTPTIIHEMQAEPWPVKGKPIPEASLAEQNKTFNAGRFEKRFDYAKNTGMRSVYFWGAEYWYYRWQILGDKSVWQVAMDHFEASTRNTY